MRSLLSLSLLFTPVAAFADETRASAPHGRNDGPQFEISTGVEYEEGDYGTDTKINILSVPTSVKLSTGDLQLIATLPYRRVEGPSSVVPGGVLGLPILLDPNQPQTENVTREGWGDLELGVVYAIPTTVVNLAISGSVKLPTAENNLGTGATDYTLGTEVSRPFAGGIIPFASFSYTFLGSPEGYSLQDSYAASGGIATKIGPATQGYLSYRYADNASQLISSDQRLITGLNTRLGKVLSLGVYGSTGLSEGAPEFTTGLRIGMALN
ncbi:hypothetical protein [Croceicoccus naphthovorans]|uniref:hypothetical protein n=1 Tax=Croceicoccus naphthovorans TaxID=1348774 RepID=UPI00069DCE2F|nr:hypothetical protein [Croceicoccus naphthovorans]MBB3991689.1 hypothetical protein [Croceicoccus naphthovorans]